MPLRREDYIDDLIINKLSKEKWDKDKINEWYDNLPWMIGCNYIPSNAINQLEMFQTDTFDPERIDLELGWAQELGFNTLRIYLHFLLWKAGFQGLKNRIDRLLNICDSHGMKVLFVLFDDCWQQDPEVGIQPDPIPGIHNSGWAASPGRKRVLEDDYYPELQQYIQDLLKNYANNRSIIGWDLYNEPGNFGMNEKSLPLLIASFLWARDVNPSQPLTVGVWHVPAKTKLWHKFFDVSTSLSDIISFHHYEAIDKTIKVVEDLNKFNRPLLCTEYLARTNGNLFKTHLPFFKAHKIAAFNWGLVAGKTQTIYSWLSKKGDPRPDLWYHDIFFEDGRPYNKQEIDFIKSILKAYNSP
jgi:hypothetical protein